MQIKAKPREPLLPRRRRLRFLPRKLAWGLPVVLGLGFALGFLFSREYVSSGRLRDDFARWAHNHGYYVSMTNVSPSRALLKAPTRYLDLARHQNDVPEIVLDVKFKNMLKIQEKRREALRLGYLVQGGDDLVPASIRIGDRTVPVRIRLKGDDVDHLEHSSKWSYRVEVRRGDQIFGMRRFSLQHPKTRGFQGEPLYLRTLKDEGVLVPRYFFVDVTVNGKRIGVMALEEHFSKELLESSERREGVILKFDEDIFWEGRMVDVYHNPLDNFRSATIDAFGEGKIERSPKLSQDYAVGVGLLRGFVTGAAPASEVFDADLLGRFLGVAEYWGTPHPIRWHNLRFYLNPIDMKLEPIGFDGNLHGRELVRRDPELLLVPREPVTSQMLADPVVRRSYLDTIHRLAQETLQGDLLERLRKLEAKEIADLGREFYLLWPYPLEEQRRRSEFLATVDESAVLQAPRIPATGYELDSLDTVAQAYVVRQEGRTSLQVMNLMPAQLTVLGIRLLGPDGSPLSAPVETVPPLPWRLGPTAQGELPATLTVDLPFPTDTLSLALDTRLDGSPEVHRIVTTRYAPVRTTSPIPQATLEETLRALPALVPDSGVRLLRCPPGRWTVAGSLVLPAGWGLELDPGTTLRFPADGALVARGPLRFLGSETAPVRLEGPDGGTFLGVAVLGAEGDSEWQHVVVGRTSGVQFPGWQLTGGVNFDESPVRLVSCSFEGTASEDALNVVRTHMEFEDIRIRDTVSDAFDADFVEGSIEGGFFEGIGSAGGGDAIDVSGTHLTIRGTRFENVSDKAVSVGEGSHVTASSLDIDSVLAGAASKDGSTLELMDTSIRNVGVAALMAYVKKPEFGPATLNATGIRLEGVAVPAIAQTGNRIVLDGETVATREVDVDELYETVMRPGLRR